MKDSVFPSLISIRKFLRATLTGALSFRYALVGTIMLRVIVKCLKPLFLESEKSNRDTLAQIR